MEKEPKPKQDRGSFADLAREIMRPGDEDRIARTVPTGDPEGKLKAMHRAYGAGR